MTASWRDALSQSVERAYEDNLAAKHKPASLACHLQPLAFNVVVELDPVEEKTAGGIILIHEETERQKHAAQKGTLVAKSPLAFTYAEWPEGSSPPDVGARVMVSRYTGLLEEKDGKHFRIVEDKSVIAVIGEE